MHRLQSLLAIASALSLGCLASEPPPVAMTTALVTPVIVTTYDPPQVPVQPGQLLVAVNPFGSQLESPRSLRGDVYPLPVNTDHLPDFRFMQPIASLYTSEIDIPPRRFDLGFPGVADRVEWFGVQYVGDFNVAAGGVYHFRVNSDDGARLVLDGQPVVNNDGIHPPRSADGSVVLSPGTHHLVLDYFQGPRYDIALQLFWSPPGQSEQIFRV